MKDISIIIPAYNAEKYLNKCLDSLINQTMNNIEIIIVNDGSKDNTEEIVKSYSDKRIKYYKNDNHGIGYTRNFGISKATGKYVMFLDSDDYVEKNICEELFNKAENDGLDLVICDFYKEYDNGKKEKIITETFKNSSLKDNPDIITEYLAPWAKLYKRELLIDNKIKFVENLKYEDAPFVIEALDRAKLIGKVDKCLVHYIVHGNSETTIRDKRIFDIFKIIKKIRDYAKEKKYLKDRIDKLTVRIITNYTIQQREQENKEDAMQFIDEAFDLLEKEVPDYKNNKYYIGRGLIRRSIEKNKLLTKMYCKLYRR